MTTTIIKTIKPGGGGDYLTLNAFQTGEAANLVAADQIKIAEVYSGGNASTGTGVNFSTWTTDAAHYIEIRAAAGEGHTGVYSTSKAYALSTTDALVQSSKDVRLTHMQFNGRFQVLLPTPPVGHEARIDSCIIVQTGTNSPRNLIDLIGGSPPYGTITIQNNVILNENTGGGGNMAFNIGNTGATVNIYNNTFGGSDASRRGLNVGGATPVVTIQNNYISGTTCYVGSTVGGTNDATSTTEAVTPSLRSIPYSTATFLSVTAGSENLRPVVSGSNKLLDHGANLTAQGVTQDILGVARPQFGVFDIGAFENDIPICWNYTARYKNSNKLFKASGCGSFPKTLQVPSNVDKSTGRMVDDGVIISPSEYEVI